MGELLPACSVTVVKRRPINPAWGDGPWRDEPDRLEWRDEATGLPCLIRRTTFGSLCGYVAVPPGHPLHGHQGLQGLPDEVEDASHGGITNVSESWRHGDDGLWFMALPGDDTPPSKHWWFGFDCAHAGGPGTRGRDVQPRGV